MRFSNCCYGSVCVVLALAALSQAEDLQINESLKQRSLAVLREGLASEEFWPAMHAAEALTLSGHGAEVRAQLTPLLPQEADGQKRCGLARELVRAGDWSQSRVMLEILDQKETYAHTHAAESLFKVFEIGDGIGLRRLLSSDEKLTARLMAAAALARCGSPAAFTFIREQLREGDEEARRIAAWILSRIGNESDIPQLKESLKSLTEPLAIAFTNYALAMLGDPEGQKVLKENLKSSEASLRTYAAVFAGEINGFREVDLLSALLDDASLDTRIRAAQSLLMLSQSQADNDSEDIRRLVYKATDQNPRYTEGSVLRLRNGNLLYAVTEFVGGGSDFATAHIVASESSDGGRTWGEPRILQESTGDMNVMSVTLRRLQAPQDGRIALFYLEKNSYSDLPAYVRFSDDEGLTFSEPVRITKSPGYHVMNNDRVTQLSSGRLLAPFASSPDVHMVFKFETWCCYSDDGGASWKEGEGKVSLPKRGAMEPEVIELKDGRVMMIIRTQLGYIAKCYSDDGGNTWGEPEQLSDLIAPEAPATIRRVPATGDLLLVWNNTFKEGSGHGGARTPLTAAISSDEGKTWKNFRNLEDKPQETYAYTSITFVEDRVLMTYWVESGRKYSSRFRSLPVAWLYEQ